MQRFSIAVLFLLVAMFGGMLQSIGGAAEAAPATKAAEKNAAPARRRPQLMRADREAQLRRSFPKVQDSEVRALLASDDLVIYTDAEMPKAYQFWDGAFPGVHSVNYNISANGSEPFGNGNREFPWSAPAGTHRATTVSSFRFLRLPTDEQGRAQPVVWYRKRLSGDSSLGYAWTFPRGTVFGEVLTMRGHKNLDYTFEVRLRRREVGHWDVDVLRPFPTAGDLAERIKELRPDWQERPNLVKLCSHLEQPAKMQVLTLVDRHPQKRTFQQSMGVDKLPSVEDPALVAELLTTTPFKSALGETWRGRQGQTTTCAPTTDAAFHIVPASYDAGFVAVDSQSCMRCHESVNQSVNKFQSGRDWYGRIRGSDGIFSFHPFAKESVSGNGHGASVLMRAELESAGMLEAYNAKRHSNAVYSALDGIRE